MAHDPAALQETAYAKVNLALHVRARLPDGYHRIETLFAFCEDGDRLTATPSDDLSLTIDGPFGADLSSDDDNLVVRAAQALRDAAGISQGAALHLTKELPIASGVGGGSSDAAATLRLLHRLWNLDAHPERVQAICAELGADVPACLSSQTSFGTGRGDEIALIEAPALQGLPILLVNPGISVPTGPVFAAWDQIDRGPLNPVEPFSIDPDWRNDLQAPALSIAPEIQTILDVLAHQDGVGLVRMSGSGATCFALFDTEKARDRAAGTVSGEYAQWWLLPTRLR